MLLPESCTPNQQRLASLSDGLILCKILHTVLSPLGFYPSLTGGLLYKDGQRKDIDILIYRHRQDVEKFEMTDIFKTLESVGLTNLIFYGFVTKAEWNGFTVDLFNPESTGSEECSL